MKTSLKKLNGTMLLLVALFAAQVASAFYDPNLGRWANRDPLDEEYDLNLYRLVESNPINYVDPFGLQLTGAGTVALEPTLLMSEEAAAAYNARIAAAAAAAAAANAANTKCDSKAWQHESPNPDKTRKRGDHKNRPDGKRDRDPQPKPPEKPPQNPPMPPYDGPPKDGGPPRPRLDK